VEDRGRGIAVTQSLLAEKRLGQGDFSQRGEKVDTAAPRAKSQKQGKEVPCAGLRCGDLKNLQWGEGTGGLWSILLKIGVKIGTEPVQSQKTLERPKGWSLKLLRG